MCEAFPRRPSALAVSLCAEDGEHKYLTKLLQGLSLLFLYSADRFLSDGLPYLQG